MHVSCRLAEHIQVNPLLLTRSVTHHPQYNSSQIPKAWPSKLFTHSLHSSPTRDPGKVPSVPNENQREDYLHHNSRIVTNQGFRCCVVFSNHNVIIIQRIYHTIARSEPAFQSRVTETQRPGAGGGSRATASKGERGTKRRPYFITIYYKLMPHISGLQEAVSA